MQQHLFSHPRLAVKIKTGSEGPRHDPYHYREMIVRHNGNTTIIHEGLMVWLRHNDADIPRPSTKSDREESDWYRKAFIKLVGFTPEQIERIHRRLRARCSHCGGKRFINVPGFPGETLVVCESCNQIVDGTFDISAVE